MIIVGSCLLPCATASLLRLCRSLILVVLHTAIAVWMAMPEVSPGTVDSTHKPCMCGFKKKKACVGTSECSVHAMCFACLGCRGGCVYNCNPEAIVYYSNPDAGAGLK